MTYKPQKKLNPEFLDRELIKSEKLGKNIDLKEKLKALTVDAGTEPIFVHDLNGNFTYVNKTALKYFGYSKEEFMKINLHDIYSSKFFINLQIETLTSKNPLIFQSIYLKEDKSVIPVEIRVKIIDLYGEKLILSIFRDNIKREKIEKAIKEKEGDLSIVTDNMLDFIYYVNSEGTFEYASPSINWLLGYDVEDIIGKKDLELINIAHPEDVEIILEALQIAIETLKPKRLQHRYKHKDGHYIWVETIGNPIANEKGEFDGAVYITRDITELKNVENQFKESLREKESLLREVHHRVKNNMQIISSLLNLQLDYINNEKAFNIIKESQDRIRSMALVHEELYRSDDLSKINFADYIKRLLPGIFRSYGVDSQRIKLKISAEDIFLDIKVAIPCGLVINELVSNSLKHAFLNDIKGEINVNFYSKGSKRMLIISDDGIGFPEEIDFKNTSTLGMQLVNMLVSQLDGQIGLNKDKGSLFKIIF